TAAGAAASAVCAPAVPTASGDCSTTSKPPACARADASTMASTVAAPSARIDVTLPCADASRATDARVEAPGRQPARRSGAPRRRRHVAALVRRVDDAALSGGADARRLRVERLAARDQPRVVADTAAAAP